jgi:hypothetical protein
MLSFSISYSDLIKSPCFADTTEKGHRGWKQAQREGEDSITWMSIFCFYVGPMVKWMGWEHSQNSSPELVRWDVFFLISKEQGKKYHLPQGAIPWHEGRGEADYVILLTKLCDIIFQWQSYTHSSDQNGFVEHEFIADLNVMEWS